MTWIDLLEHWELIECDLHSEYGIDIDTPSALTSRSWRWLRTRIFGLLSADTRLGRAMAPPDDEPQRG